MLRALLLCLVLFTPATLVAHGTGGTYETTVDGYVVDIGYTPEVIDTESQVRFDFSAYEELETASSTEFTDVWVRVSNDGQLFFAGNINRPIFGPTGFSTVLGTPGEYQVFARFQADGESLVEVSFPLTVAAATESSSTKATTLGLVALVLVFGMGLGFLVGRRFI